ncbi:Na+/H+ antiporter NhaC family protein [Saccharicrinis fermentans]|uniref:Malate-2H(+)/Na(+)-lactate antiporter n=1 Tax=Saccharicrinis fermentans DSM 9555 = JCM 21142 TaxID=869213 RepID=W7YAN5_9BACT|nr:Na+/H+ antiporter NhaC family protein [Saccharicrinis fermentans]GAF01406.1 malate-2H(+)/Na(+)-lactate antiporter [Saccharicrinis fermentans DSM 9555 = JCM 21142]
MSRVKIAIFLILTLFAKGIQAQNSTVEFISSDIFVTSIETDIKLQFDAFPDSIKEQIQITLNGKKQLINWDNNYASLQTRLYESTTLKAVADTTVLYEKELSPIPLWFSIWPPLIAIFMALLTKEVFSSLFVGLLVGTTIIWKYKGFSLFISLFKGLFSVVDTYALSALLDSDHLSIIIFSMLIGGMVTLITLNGGMKGIVSILARYARNRRSGQFITWLMGLMIFFDDYANTLVVGNTMRPVTDKLKVSREKLAYIVDSTSAPIASVAFITTWIGAELSYISEGINQLGIDKSAYQVFINSLSYAFYPIFTLGFVLMLILKKRDFGPMLKAELKAYAANSPDSLHNSSHAPQIMKEIELNTGVKGRWYNAFIPVMVVILGTIGGLVYTGYDTEVWHSKSIDFSSKLSIIIGNADSFKALIWSSLGGVLMAIILTTAQRILNFKDTIEGLVNGFKTMFNAVLVLTLAWSIALITTDMHTASFITETMRSIQLNPYWIPALAFVFSALIAFSTGSSWGTMAIIYPLILPACWKISMDAGMDINSALPVFYNVVSTVLAGSVLGDHCSPISDTTILSSLASSCNHLAHVRTQLPYALLVGTVSLFVGTIPGAFGVPIWVLLLTGFTVLYLVIIKFGKKID